MGAKPFLTWECTYYHEPTKRWQSGTLRLFRRGINYRARTLIPSADSDTVSISFDEINAIKKTTVTLVYSAIVIMTSSNKYWFSSFVNRNDVASTLEHFQKERLFMRSTSKDGEDITVGNKNAELLRLAYTAQDTLTEAAMTLQRQGQQLSGIGTTMNHMHNDLDVAGNITQSLESWTGIGSVGKQMGAGGENRQNVGAKGSAIDPQKIEYSVLYARIAQESHNHGIFVLRENSIEVLDAKSSTVVHSFRPHEVSDVDVHSPVDATLTKRAIGASDQLIHLISTHLVFIMNTFVKLYGDNLGIAESMSDFNSSDTSTDNDLDEDEMFGVCDATEVGESSQLSSTSASRDDLFKTSPLHSSGKITANKVSDEDMGDISKVLRNMTSLARDVGREQDNQLETLDQLNKTVGQATDRIVSTDKRVKKLL